MSHKWTLRRHRHNKGLKQSEAAGRAGISTTYWSDIERGERSPSLEKARHIAHALDTHIDKIFPPGELYGPASGLPGRVSVARRLEAWADAKDSDAKAAYYDGDTATYAQLREQADAWRAAAQRLRTDDSP